MKALFIMVLICFYSCSSATQVKNVKAGKSTGPAEFNKIFVLSLTPNKTLRKNFESRLQKSLRKENIEVFSAGDFISSDFYHTETTEKALQKLEDSLITRGFENVLLAKIIRVENRKSIGHSLADFSGSHRSFKSDYYNNQQLMFEDEENAVKLYHTYTSLYKLPKNGQKEVIWEGEIVVKNKPKLKKATRNYVDTLISELKKRGIL